MYSDAWVNKWESFNFWQIIFHFNVLLSNIFRYHESMENERAAREAAAKDVVAGLGGSLLNGDGSGELASVADSIESILASIVSDAPPAPSA